MCNSTKLRFCNKMIFVKKSRFCEVTGAFSAKMIDFRMKKQKFSYFSFFKKVSILSQTIDFFQTLLEM